MKQKVGELNGKCIVVTAIPEELTYNEYLLENTDTGIILKQRDSDGNIVNVSEASTTKVDTSNDTENVTIALNSTIKGPNKWVKGSSYIFYINKNDKFIITTTDGKYLNATLVATGKTDKVYEINSKDYTSITIKEA